MEQSRVNNTVCASPIAVDPPMPAAAPNAGEYTRGNSLRIRIFRGSFGVFEEVFTMRQV